MNPFYKRKWMLQPGAPVPEFRPRDPSGTFLMLRTDTIFLSRLQVILSPTEDEEAVLLTGVKYSDVPNRKVLIPTCAFMPRYTRQSMSGVEAEPEDIYRIEQTVVGSGQELVLRAHSHPGPGRGMCNPSSEDRDDQRRWEDSGYETPSAIFTRVLNGTFYVCFFALKLELSVEVLGDSRSLGGGVYEIPATAR